MDDDTNNGGCVQKYMASDLIYICQIIKNADIFREMHYDKSDNQYHRSKEKGDMTSDNDSQIMISDNDI